MNLDAGTRLGPYEVLSPPGSGGTDEVWKARDKRLNRIVAIKTSRNEFSERFEREAHAVAAVNHSNIWQLYDVGPNHLAMVFNSYGYGYSRLLSDLYMVGGIR